MFYNFFIKISLILVIIVTFSICALKPKMHKAVLIYNSDYKVEETQEATLKSKTTKNIEEKNYKIPTYSRTENRRQQQTNKKIQDSQKTTKKVTVTQAENLSQRKTTVPSKTQSVQKHNNLEPQTRIQKIEEEEIQWNKWHSDIQNQIMKDVKLPILPKGTIFKFSFDVDKYGKISDVKAWSMTPSLTPYAIQYIAPVIKSYQGHSILNFPQGTKRYTTTFVGGWKIAESVQYSSPKDFNDKEIIQKRIEANK